MVKDMLDQAMYEIEDTAHFLTKKATTALVCSEPEEAWEQIMMAKDRIERMEHKWKAVVRPKQKSPPKSMCSDPSYGVIVLGHGSLNQLVSDALDYLKEHASKKDEP